MIFSAESIAAILAGTKRQTRRVVKEIDWVPSHDMFVTREFLDGKQVPYVARMGSPDRYVVNKTYSVQPGRGKASVARIRVTEIRYCARAGAISADDARAEGFASPDDFRATYARLNGIAALDAPCWALSFALVEGGA